MVWLMRRCEKCGNYMMKRNLCPHCGGQLRLPHPPKFSPDDKYLKYRMALKLESQQSERDLH